MCPPAYMVPKDPSLNRVKSTTLDERKPLDEKQTICFPLTMMFQNALTLILQMLVQIFSEDFRTPNSLWTPGHEKY